MLKLTKSVTECSVADVLVCFGSLLHCSHNQSDQIHWKEIICTYVRQHRLGNTHRSLRPFSPELGAL